ncbi:MAG: sulfotransferase family 2 domain-containing protein [Candidatus Niyogibacteria bacterium]|nr:sulfotransferase family 2 domain-containing protein [Candidatus Niyogibacteria bacterium]
MNTSGPIIFVHIVKGGGVTLQHIISRHFPQSRSLRTAVSQEDSTLIRFEKLTQKEKDSIQFLYGHVPFGLHRYFSYPCRYITMLREPVARVISFYYYAQEKKSSPYKADQLAKGITLKDFIESDIAMVANFQTRMIAGEYTAGYAAARPLGEDALETAKKHIDDDIIFPGIMEQFDESLILMKKKLGLSCIYYARANENKNPKYRSEKENIPAHIIEIIKKNNAFDIALYDYAKSRFERMKKEYGPSFDRDLRRFQKWNKWYQALRINKVESLARMLRVW